MGFSPTAKTTCAAPSSLTDSTSRICFGVSPHTPTQTPRHRWNALPDVVATVASDGSGTPSTRRSVAPTACEKVKNARSTKGCSLRNMPVSLRMHRRNNGRVKHLPQAANAGHNLGLSPFSRERLNRISAGSLRTHVEDRGCRPPESKRTSPGLSQLAAYAPTNMRQAGIELL